MTRRPPPRQPSRPCSHCNGIHWDKDCPTRRNHQNDNGNRNGNNGNKNNQKGNRNNKPQNPPVVFSASTKSTESRRNYHPDSDWVLDSGATIHCTSQIQLLYEIEETNERFKLQTVQLLAFKRERLIFYLEIQNVHLQMCISFQI